MIPRLLNGVLVTLILATPASAQRSAKIPDPDPELERQSFIVADGFEVNLYAADPLLAKPIQMNFDPAGRLWVACSETYPLIKPGQPARDKIIVLEDTKGAGRADKTTVFADGLLIPTGLEPGDGGVYVANSTELLHLADTDGDGKADKRRVLLSGFGTEDTHHLLHTLRWGPDGMLYMNQSVYIHSHVETPFGPRRLNAGGIWQLRPESLHLEVFARGWWNAWGHHFDRFGQSFVADGAGTEGVNYVIPGAYYPAAVAAPRLFHGLNPGSPKYCGLEILSGRHLPEAWQGNLITNDFRGHRVCRFILQEDGAGYAALLQSDLIKTTHEAFRPIDMKMGPDGAIYIADWYNPIIQHGEVDFRDPRRDLTHGRIWRVTAKGRPLVPRPQLVGAATEQLLDVLRAPEGWTREQARRVLKERGAAKVLPALKTWVEKLDPKSPEDETLRLEALWIYQSLDMVEPKLLASLLEAKEGRVRAAATRVLAYWQERIPRALELLAERVSDEHPRVRLEAVRALGRIPDRKAFDLALSVQYRPLDRFLDYALFLTVRELAPVWQPALERDTLVFRGQPGHLLFALDTVDSAVAMPLLLRLVKIPGLPPDKLSAAWTLIASQGGPEELKLVFDKLLTPPHLTHLITDALRAALLRGLEQAARQRGVRPAGELEPLLEVIMSSRSPEVRAPAIRLIGLWKLEKLRSLLVELARAPDKPPSVREVGLEGLVALGGPGSKEVIEAVCGKDQPAEVRGLAVTALAKLDVEAAVRQAVIVLPLLADPAAMVGELVQHKNGPAALAKHLAGTKVPPDVAKLALRAVHSSGRNLPQLVEAFTRAGGLTTPKPILAPEEMRALVEEVAQRGDPGRGEIVYRRPDMICQKCHALSGAGGQVGPDLTSLGASAQVDYLIDSLLLPNKAIKEGYHSLVLSTKSGRLHTGIKVRETATEVVLRDAEDREVVVPTKQIDERTNGKSLMPDGLVDPLTRAELVDLVRFLSELGKVGPYAATKARLARTWQVAESSPEAQAFLERRGLVGVVHIDSVLSWRPAYSQVSGLVPLDGLPALTVSKQIGTVTVVRCRLDVTTAGRVRLRLNAPEGVSLWLDQNSRPAQPSMEWDLEARVHTLTLVLDRSQRHDSIRLELEEIPGSRARAGWVVGK